VQIEGVEQPTLSQLENGETGEYLKKTEKIQEQLKQFAYRGHENGSSSCIVIFDADCGDG